MVSAILFSMRDCREAEEIKMRRNNKVEVSENNRGRTSLQAGGELALCSYCLLTHSHIQPSTCESSFRPWCSGVPFRKEQKQALRAAGSHAL